MENKTLIPALQGEIDLNYCREYIKQLSNTLRGYLKAHHNINNHGLGIGLCGFENPYEELKNVISQSYNNSLDLAVAQRDEHKYRLKARELSNENERLNEEVHRLRDELTRLKECATDKAEQKQLKQVREFFSMESPKEWRENMSEIIDALICGVLRDSDYSWGKPLYSARELEEFFRGFESE